jgi:hypothetical protein
MPATCHVRMQAAAKKKDKKKKLALLEERALGWGGFDDKPPPEKVTVVLKGMFAMDELIGDIQAAGARVVVCALGGKGGGRGTQPCVLPGFVVQGR